MLDKRTHFISTLIFGTFLLITAGIPSAVAQGTPVEFSGTWNTVTGKGKKIIVTLKSANRRTTVNGTYGVNALTASSERPHQNGASVVFVNVSFAIGGSGLQSQSTITGTVTDNVLRFKWIEDGGRGSGRFTMSADGESFTGTFSLNDNPDDTSGGTWNGTRAPNFSGAWQTSVYPSMVLQQSGNQVTGQLIPGRPDLGMIRDGVIKDNTLRFSVYRSILPNSYPNQIVGTGELVMDKGNKSFKGTILGAPVSGIRLGGR